MPDRVVKVTLTAAVADYRAKMLEAANATRAVGTEGEKLKQTREAFDAVGRAGLIGGGLLATGFGIAVAKAKEFDAQMSNVQAATGETRDNMDLLRDAAIEAGASTVYSATEAAQAIEELAKAGVSTADILAGGLRGSLDLAAAGQLDVARAAEITSTALNQFGLTGNQATHVADVLAAGAGKAMGSVDDLAEGLKYVGPVAKAMGVSLEDTTGVLALFAQQGIIGEQAGTSLRGVLSSLTAPSSQARAEIERLGLSLYDSKGNFLGLENAAGQLSKAYTNMDGKARDASLGVIFGRETITAATALYKAGAQGVEEWSDKVNDSGFAAEQARKRLDNLNGDLEALRGALDSALIETGSAANDTLRVMVQSLSAVVDAYNDLPDPIKEATLLVGGATAAILLSGGAALTVVPKFLEMRATVRAAGLSMGGLSAASAGVGLALAGLFAIFGELARQQGEYRQQADSYLSTLEAGTNRVTKATKEVASAGLAARSSFFWMEHDSTFDAAEKLGISLDLVRDAAVGDVDALKQLQVELDKARALSLAHAGSAGEVERGVARESGSIQEAIRVAQQKQKADANSVESSKSAATAYLDSAQAVGNLEDQLSQLIDTINEANGVGQDAVSANIDYQNALAQVDETIQKARDGADGYALTLDTNTQAGRDNMDMLVDLAKQAQDAADKQFQLDGNTDAYRATLENSRQALIDRATDLGLNAGQAQALADQIFRIPSETDWKVIAETQAATDKANAFKNLWESLRDRTITLNMLTIGGVPTPQYGPLAGGYSFAPGSANGNESGGLYERGVEAFENGGFPSGIYRGGSDIHKFAEKSLPWEAYISPKPDQRERNIGIWQETGRRLGVSGGEQAPQVVHVPVQPVTEIIRFVMPDGRTMSEEIRKFNRSVGG